MIIASPIGATPIPPRATELVEEVIGTQVATELPLAVGEYVVISQDPEAGVFQIISIAPSDIGYPKARMTPVSTAAGAFMPAGSIEEEFVELLRRATLEERRAAGIIAEVEEPTVEKDPSTEEIVFDENTATPEDGMTVLDPYPEPPRKSRLKIMAPYLIAGGVGVVAIASIIALAGKKQ